MRAAPSLALLALCGVATAAPREADTAFARGRELMKAKKYAEACAAFEQSYQADPALGTLFNLADCEVDLGKLATAWNHYRQLARTDSNADRRAMSDRLANQLAPRVPKLLVTIDGKPAGVALAIDGHDATGQLGAELPVDLGLHTVAVTAPGFAAWQESVSVGREGMVSNVVVRLVPVAADRPASAEPSDTGPHAPAGTTPASAAAAAPGDRRHRVGTIAVIAGGGLVVAGLVAGGLAYSQWQDAKTCTGCDRASESHGALIRGDVSTALVAAGLIAAGVGVYLWKTSSSAATATATLVPGGGGLAIAGAW